MSLFRSIGQMGGGAPINFTPIQVPQNSPYIPKQPKAQQPAVMAPAGGVPGQGGGAPAQGGGGLLGSIMKMFGGGGPQVGAMPSVAGQGPVGPAASAGLDPSQLAMLLAGI